MLQVLLDRKRKVRKVALVNPTEKYPMKLVEKIVLSHDTRLFRWLLG